MHNVSLVIPLYNKEPYIKRCLESVARQTVKPLEVIVVDDGSTDDGVSAAMSVPNLRIKLISQANQGASVARNTGIAIAQGEWIAFLDADDELLPDCLEILTSNALKFPKADIVFGWSAQSSTQESLESEEGPSIMINDYFRYLMEQRGREMNSSSLMIKRQVFQVAGGFPPNVKVGEDTDMWLRAACVADIVAVQRNVSVYHIDAGDSDWKSRRPDDAYWYKTYRDWREQGKIPSNKQKSIDRYFVYSLIQKAIFLINENRKIEAARILVTRVDVMHAPVLYYAKALVYCLTPGSVFMYRHRRYFG